MARKIRCRLTDAEKAGLGWQISLPLSVGVSPARPESVPFSRLSTLDSNASSTPSTVSVWCVVLVSLSLQIVFKISGPVRKDRYDLTPT